MWRNRYGRRHRQWRDQGRGDRRCVLSIESKAPSISSDLIQKSGSGGNVPCIGYSEISVRNAVPISLPRNGLSICRIIAFGMCGRAIHASIGLRIRFTCRVSGRMHHKSPATPAAWRYSPRSAAPHRELPKSQRRYAPQSSVKEAFSRKGAFQCILSQSWLSLLACTFSE